MGSARPSAKPEPRKLLAGNLLCYGDARPLACRVPLRAGPLRMHFEAGTLRGMHLADLEILKHLYVAVRDPNWDTIPGALSGLKLQRGKDSFLISYRSVHRHGPIHFGWDARIEGRGDGTLRFEMNGVARSTFQRARIGLCLLHPAQECAGLACEVARGGTTESASFPTTIAPEGPLRGFHAMRALTFEPKPGVRVRFEFEGDLFETEDQRNWTDASFKTFSTPLHLPIPVTVRRGERIRQAVTIQVTGADLQAGAGETRPPVVLRLGKRASGKLPKLGLGDASHGRPLHARELARLAPLAVSHLRVDLDMQGQAWTDAIRTAARNAHALGARLEIAVLNAQGTLPPSFAATIHDALHAAPAQVSTWLLHPHSPANAKFLQRNFPGSAVAAGTNANFFSFNDSPPRGKHFDLAAFAIHPQTHATDNDSLIETLEIQGAAARQAAQLARGLPVSITPVTLKPRFNPDAAGPEPPTPPGELPPQVDVRQLSLFGAAWTLGSLKYLSEAGVQSITYFETTGWRGVMESIDGSPLPRRFPSLPGAVFPLYHVLAAVQEFRDAAIVSLASSAPLRVAGLALRRGRRTRILLANFTGSTEVVTFQGVSPAARILVLDEFNASDAVLQPARFLSQKGRQRRLGSLMLPRYAVARIDLGEAG